MCRGAGRLGEICVVMTGQPNCSRATYRTPEHGHNTVEQHKKMPVVAGRLQVNRK
jgi:hypothetical protein